MIEEGNKYPELLRDFDLVVNELYSGIESGDGMAARNLAEELGQYTGKDEALINIIETLLDKQKNIVEKKLAIWEFGLSALSPSVREAATRKIVGQTPYESIEPYHHSRLKALVEKALNDFSGEDLDMILLAAAQGMVRTIIAATNNTPNRTLSELLLKDLYEISLETDNPKVQDMSSKTAQEAIGDLDRFKRMLESLLDISFTDQQ